MRAANQPQSSTAIESHRALQPVSRIFVALLSTLALLLVWRPTVVHGQEAEGRIVSVADSTLDQVKDSATTTHVVRAGETLWGIAALFYGDGHQWPALAKRNRIATSGPAPLQVGMRLSVPASPTVRGAKAAAMAAAPADSTVPSVALAKAGEGTLPPARPSGSLSAQTAGKRNAAAGAGAAKGRAPAAAAKAAAVAAIDTVTKATIETDTSRVNFQPQHSSELMMSRKGTRIGLVDLEAQEASRKSSEVETVFHRDLPDAAEAERRTRAVLRPNTPAPRQAEFDAAPFIVMQLELAKSGSILKRVGSPGSLESEYPQRAIKTDQIEVRPPAGVTYTVGQRLVAVTTPAAADKQSMIAIPTGIVEIVRVEAGKPVLAVLTRQSGRVEQGQRLLPSAGSSAPWLVVQKLAEPDVKTSVRWIDPHELQPTLQSFLMLAAGTTQGVKAGDEFGLYRSGSKEQPSQESLVATVRVVRSESGGSAAVITRQYQSDIGVGLAARRVAKAP
ncbi:LysM peptidoglycan-binding domain-containing protein [Gemmatimonas groenlandica]|uniref:LysM peptidoglycan-binding domain-containing protein n=1 Tax=Gemmatimonas groenlandica TaxID=2732249 RepID=A0A6M4IJB4_9BACT|nr:LysM domain-containing protein [Gemmatimonas groenlandica]QJR34843.1 LysM peptidoglycan-binding domain-containing protein [Gemmatimonas groenlandica]